MDLRDEDGRPAARTRAPGASQLARTAAILRAALEELAEVGYTALSIDVVASRVGIAKTTIYRRYPTKQALVQAAIIQLVDESFAEVPDRGSLRGDLIAMGLQVVQFASSVSGQGLFRVGLLERSIPVLHEISENIENDRRQRAQAVAVRAVARNEIASAADFIRVFDMLAGVILFKLGMRREAVSELDVARMVDVLLHGVLQKTAPSKTSGE